MKTLEKLETDSAMMRSAFVLACNDMRAEFAETNDLMRRTLIATQDTLYAVPAHIDRVHNDVKETADDMRAVIVVVSCIALFAVFIAVYCYAETP